MVDKKRKQNGRGMRSLCSRREVSDRLTMRKKRMKYQTEVRVVWRAAENRES